MGRWLCSRVSKNCAVTEPLLESFASLDRVLYGWQAE